MPSRCFNARGVGLPPHPEHLDVAGIARREAFADLDRRRLAGAVGPEQPEALAGRNLEIEAAYGNDVVVGLSKTANAQCSYWHNRDPVRASQACGCLWIGSTQYTASGASTGVMSRFTTTASLSLRTRTHSRASNGLALISWCGTYGGT